MYSGVRLDRLQEVVDALEFEIEERATYSSPRFGRIEMTDREPDSS